MKSKTLQEQYNLIKEGKGHADIFIKSAKQQFPQYIRNAAGLTETINSLKHNHIISESLKDTTTGKNTQTNWFSNFNQSLNESKIVEKKPTKEVIDQEIKGYNYKDKENIINIYDDEFLKGYYTEMKDPKNCEKSIDELKEIVSKNLQKDPLHYVKNGQFGVQGLGYTEEHPGLGAPKEPQGKYKSSGYGDIKESKRSQYLKEYVNTILKNF